MEKFKQTVKAVKTNTPVFFKNLCHLILAVSLVLVATFSYLVADGTIDPTKTSSPYLYVVMCASIFIGVLGAWVFVMHLLNKEIK